MLGGSSRQVGEGGAAGPVQTNLVAGSALRQQPCRVRASLANAAAHSTRHNTHWQFGEGRRTRRPLEAGRLAPG